jgi:hypothetical protein
MKLALFLLPSLALAQAVTQITEPLNFGTNSVAANFLQTHAEPALPPLGGAGYIFKDPQFGNRILRVTDGATLTSRGFTNDSVTTSSSAESSMWRKDGSMFWTGSPVSGGVMLWNFNPSTFQATDTGQMSPMNEWLQMGGDPEFSFNDNNALYGAPSLTFIRYDVVAQTSSTLFSFGTAIPGLTGTNGDASVSALDYTGAQDDCLAAPTNGPEQDEWTAVIVWCKNTNQFAVLDFTKGILRFGGSSYFGQVSGPNWNPMWLIHNVRIGKEGRFVDITVQGSGAPYQEIWDLLLNTATAMPYSTINGGHKAQGYNYLVSPGKCGADPDAGPQLSTAYLGTPTLCQRNLPQNSTLPGPGGITDYSSWQSSSPFWQNPPMGSNESQSAAGVSVYLGTGQIVATEVDGIQQRVWQFASTHAPYNGMGPLYTAAATLSAAGSGYVVNDTGRISGCGTGDATYRVTSVSVGTVASLTITAGGGQYAPVTACTTTATSGSGSGLKITIPGTFWNNFYDTTRGGVSQDGKYYLFNSTWNGTLGTPPDGSNTFRTDTFLVELTPLTPQMSSNVSPASTAALFTTLAPDMQACTAAVYSDPGRSVLVVSATDTVRDGRTSQIVATGLSASTPYWASLTCGGGNGTVLSAFRTRASGSGTYRFTFQFGASQPMKYCTNPGMTTSCTTQSAATSHVIPVATNTVIYAAITGQSPQALLAP